MWHKMWQLLLLLIYFLWRLRAAAGVSIVIGIGAILLGLSEDAAVILGILAGLGSLFLFRW